MVMDLVYHGMDNHEKCEVAGEILVMAKEHPKFWPQFLAWINTEDELVQRDVLEEFPIWTLRVEGKTLGAIWLDCPDPHTVAVGIVKQKYLSSSAVLMALAWHRDSWLNEVFNIGTVDRIIATFDKSNRAVRAMCDVCGFKKDGILRHHVKINGEWRDYELWTLLREEWDARNNDG